MVWKPHVTVAALIEQNGRFLMVEEKINGQLVLNQPAGHLEAGESILEAVIRETREETACVFQPEKIIGLYRWQMQTEDKTFIRYCIHGVITQQLENSPLDPDIERTLWLTYDELMAQKTRLRSPLVLHCINDYCSGQSYSLNILKDLGSHAE